MNINDITTEVLPIDPSWEYYTIYSQLTQEKAELESIINWMANIENPEKTTDWELRGKLLNLIAKLRVTAHLL